MPPPGVPAQGAEVSAQAETLEELQKMSEQGDQDLQDEIDAVEDISTQTDEDLQTQVNELSTQLANALELFRLQQIQLAIANSNISDLQSRVGQLESDVAALLGDPIFALSGFLSDFATYVYMDVDLMDVDGDGSPEYLPKSLSTAPTCKSLTVMVPSIPPTAWAT